MDDHDKDDKAKKAEDLHGPVAEVAGLPAEPLPVTRAPAPLRIDLRSAVPPQPAS